MKEFTIFNCVHCNAELEYNTRGKKYCSEKCAYQVYKIKYRDKYRTKARVDPNWANEERVCFTCKATYLPKSHNQKYCNKECWLKLTTFDYIHSNKDILYSNTSHKWLKARVVVFDRDDFTCKYCGRSPMKEKGIVLHVDHKIPKKHGGCDDLDNLITSCAQCNLGKGDLLLKYWSSK